MKTIIAFCFLIVAGPASFAHRGMDGAAGVFHASLNLHGDWLRDNYGQAVWKPACVPAGWQPYTMGRWLWTADGWYWESDEPWGWATYHYGRWDFDPFMGWVWIPGLEWAPSWVEWRHGGGYVAWSPLRPIRRVHLYATHRYHNHWSYVRSHDMVKYRIHNHLLSNERKREALAVLSAKLNRKEENLQDRRGPDRRLIEKTTGLLLRERKVLRDEKRIAGLRGVHQPDIRVEPRGEEPRRTSNSGRSRDGNRKSGRSNRTE